MLKNTLVLPFAVSAKNGGEVFTLNMEVAAVLLLAKARRRKLGFFEADRKTVFVSKLHYPLWFVPWEDGSLVIDGLDVFSAIFKCPALPDVASFVEDVEQGMFDRKLFWASLEKHEKTFADFAGSVEVKVDALISDRELLSAVFEYVGEASSAQFGENVSVVLTPPKLDVYGAVERAKQFSRLHKQVQSEISSLEYVRSLLNEAVSLHEQMILKEIEFTREVYDGEIAKLKPAIEGKVDQLERERDAEIAKMNRIVENEVKAKERERGKRERELQRLELQKAVFVRRREMCRRRNDEVGLARWEHRIRVCENRIREVRRRINDLTEFIEEARRQNEAEVEKLRGSYQELIEKEKSRIISLETQRDEKIKSKQREMETLKHATAKIVNNIEELINREREREKELRRLAIPWRADDVSLVCLPFYLVGYQNGKETQLQIFPPVRVKSPKGIMKAFQKTLGFTISSRIRLFQQPMSKALERMLDFALKKARESDKAFSEALRQAAASANILAGRKFRETLIKGLEELKAEGWIGQKEVDALAKLYA
jgi:hypothetical protein